jgi:hypothetical protein
VAPDRPNCAAFDGPGLGCGRWAGIGEGWVGAVDDPGGGGIGTSTARWDFS